MKFNLLSMRGCDCMLLHCIGKEKRVLFYMLAGKILSTNTNHMGKFGILDVIKAEMNVSNLEVNAINETIDELIKILSEASVFEKNMMFLELVSLVENDQGNLEKEEELINRIKADWKIDEEKHEQAKEISVKINNLTKELTDICKK